jgi:hypothetical protein
MAFVQIVEFRSSRIDEIEEVVDEWEKATEGKRTARRRILCQDRENPNRYFNIVFFDSYEAAMENSVLPETDDLAKAITTFTEGPPKFHNFDVKKIGLS